VRLTILRNDAEVPAGHLARVALERGVEVDLVLLDEGAALPAADGVEAVAVLGGEMGAYDTDRYPFLEEEKAFLRAVVARGVPVLGLCLGCQMLADALGGAAYLAPGPEVAFAPLDLVVDDPVVDVLGEQPSLAIHRDTFDVPPGGTLVARSTRYDHAFRLGSALGVQTHPEVTPEIVRAWMGEESAVDLLAGSDLSPAGLADLIASRAEEIREVADRFFGAWLDEASRKAEA
jgi:GMP synthase (glutamine-hydrolysing)